MQIVLTFDSEVDLNKPMEMGFAESFTAAHGKLDACREATSSIKFSVNSIGKAVGILYKGKVQSMKTLYKVFT